MPGKKREQNLLKIQNIKRGITISASEIEGEWEGGN